MIETTKGIFLHHLNYSDSAKIARVYTEKFGMQSYMVNHTKSKKTGIKSNLFQPLFLLDLEVYHKTGRNIQRLKSARILTPFEDIPFNIKKSTQAIFISEVLMKCLKEEEANPKLFNFIYHAVCLLDLKDEGISNFSVSFLLRLSRYLGIFPKEPDSMKGYKYFDLNSASFKAKEPMHDMFMDAETTKKFIELFQYELSEIEKLKLSTNHRNILLLKLLYYYRIHLETSGEYKSLGILQEVFR